MPRSSHVLIALGVVVNCFTAMAQEEEFQRATPPKVQPLVADTSQEIPSETEVNSKTPDKKMDLVLEEWDKSEAVDEATAESESEGEDSGLESTLGGGDGPLGLSSAIFQGVMALCGTLALFLLLFAAFRRWGSRTPLLAGHNLGSVMGRISLSPQASLHFIRIQNEVLVVGVTQHSVNLLRTMESELFEKEGELPQTDPEQVESESGDFLSQLRAAQTSVGEAQPGAGVDEELDNLKCDLQRLKQYFQESTRARE